MERAPLSRPSDGASADAVVLLRPADDRDRVGQYASVLGDALLPQRWPYAIAVDEWEVRTVRYREDGTRVQRVVQHAPSERLELLYVGIAPKTRDPARHCGRVCRRP